MRRNQQSETIEIFEKCLETVPLETLILLKTIFRCNNEWARRLKNFQQLDLKVPNKTRHDFQITTPVLFRKKAFFSVVFGEK